MEPRYNQFDFRTYGSRPNFAQFKPPEESAFGEDAPFMRKAGIGGPREYKGSDLLQQVQMRHSNVPRGDWHTQKHPFPKTYEPWEAIGYGAATRKKAYAELASLEARPALERWKHISPDYSDLHRKQSAPTVAEMAVRRNQSDSGRFSGAKDSHRAFSMYRREQFRKRNELKVKDPRPHGLRDTDAKPLVIRRFLRLFDGVWKRRSQMVYADMAKTYLASPRVLRMLAHGDEEGVIKLRHLLHTISIKPDAEITPQERKFMSHITQLHAHHADVTSFITPVDQAMFTMTPRFVSQVNSHTNDILIKMPKIPKRNHPLVKAIVFELLREGKRVTPQTFIRKKEQIMEARKRIAAFGEFNGRAPRASFYIDFAGVSEATLNTFNMFGREKIELYKPTHDGDVTTAADYAAYFRDTVGIQRPEVMPADVRNPYLGPHHFAPTNPSITASKLKKQTEHYIPHSYDTSVAYSAHIPLHSFGTTGHRPRGV